MAEAWLRYHGGDRFEAFSAGLDPTSIHPLTVKVMEEKGIDIGCQRPKDAMEFLGRERFEYVIVVCDEVNRSCPTVFPGVNLRIFWPLEDPAALRGEERERLDGFRNIRDRIEDLIRAWLEQVAKPLCKQNRSRQFDFQE